MTLPEHQEPAVNDSQRRAVPPSGVVTFLFTDVEGSTRRWEADADAMRAALAAHDEVLGAATSRFANMRALSRCSRRPLNPLDPQTGA